MQIRESADMLNMLEIQHAATWKGFAAVVCSSRHSLVPKRKVQVPKNANIGFFAPKPYFNSVYRDFLFDRKFCLVEILKRWNRLGV